jgi:hypothetical protein
MSRVELVALLALLAESEHETIRRYGQRLARKYLSPEVVL